MPKPAVIQYLKRSFSPHFRKTTNDGIDRLGLQDAPGGVKVTYTDGVDGSCTIGVKCAILQFSQTTLEELPHASYNN